MKIGLKTCVVGALALAGVGGTALAVTTAGPASCTAKVERQLLTHVYRSVPERAGYAARRICADREHGKIQPPWLPRA